MTNPGEANLINLSMILPVTNRCWTAHEGVYDPESFATVEQAVGSFSDQEITFFIDQSAIRPDFSIRFHIRDHIPVYR